MSPVAKNLMLQIAAIVGVAGVVLAAVVVYATTRDDGSSRREPVAATVKIELRGKPVAVIKMNGRAIGRTPTTIIVPRGTTPLELEATFTIEKYGLAKPAKKTEIWRQVKQVVPDAEQSVDFSQAEATKVTASVGAP